MDPRTPVGTGRQRRRALTAGSSLCGKQIPCSILRRAHKTHPQRTRHGICFPHSLFRFGSRVSFVRES